MKGLISIMRLQTVEFPFGEKVAMGKISIELGKISSGNFRAANLVETLRLVKIETTQVVRIHRLWKEHQRPGFVKTNSSNTVRLKCFSIRYCNILCGRVE